MSLFYLNLFIFDQIIRLVKLETAVCCESMIAQLEPILDWDLWDFLLVLPDSSDWGCLKWFIGESIYQLIDVDQIKLKGPIFSCVADKHISMFFWNLARKLTGWRSQKIANLHRASASSLYSNLKKWGKSILLMILDSF